MGFFGNVLAVLDSLLLAPPGVEVEVDWRYNRVPYKHFTYAPPRPSDCVWKALFKPVRGHVGGDSGDDDPSPVPAASGHHDLLELDGFRFNFLLTSRFRWFFRTSPHNAAQRRAYHEIYTRWVRPAHPELVALMQDGGLGSQLKAHISIGVHKRVDTPGTVEYQGARRVYSSEEFIRAVKALIAGIETDPRRPQFVERIFLATDDANAESAFRAAFGSRLCMRDGVQRVAGGLNEDGTLNEVHIASPHNPSCSLSDAVDVVADALLLSCCGWVVHMDSNVTSTVTLMNPDVQMVHMVDV